MVSGGAPLCVHVRVSVHVSARVGALHRYVDMAYGVHPCVHGRAWSVGTTEHTHLSTRVSVCMCVSAGPQEG